MGIYPMSERGKVGRGCLNDRTQDILGSSRGFKAPSIGLHNEAPGVILDQEASTTA